MRSVRLGARLYLGANSRLALSLPPSACSNPLCRHPPLPPRRPPLVLRLFALALADGSGLPFSLYPPPAALESQTPQREARALLRRAQSLPRCAPQLSPPGRAALIRHGAVPRHSTAPPSPRGRQERLPPLPSASARANSQSTGGEGAENFAASSAKKLPAANFLTLFVLHFRL